MRGRAGAGPGDVCPYKPPILVPTCTGAERHRADQMQAAPMFGQFIGGQGRGAVWSTVIGDRDPHRGGPGKPGDLHGEEPVSPARTVLDRIGGQLNGHHEHVIAGRSFR